jgi:16S rRNA (guanine966-N2)-methyltransferase
MPRIIAGEAGGIHLTSPNGQKTRPTADKTKEALFSILMNRVMDSNFLDIFAGSGQVALEAVSRGAAHAWMVENAGPALACIRHNLEKTRLTDRVSLLPRSASQALKSLKQENRLFDLIYMDPPWKQAESEFLKLSQLLSELLTSDGLLIIEHDSKQQFPDYVTKLKCFRRCQYGSAMLSFYQLDYV